LSVRIAITLRISRFVWISGCRDNGGSVWICKPKWSIGLYYGNDDKWDDLGYPSLNYMKLATGIGRCEA
jgi:hypothetical protein